MWCAGYLFWIWGFLWPICAVMAPVRSVLGPQVGLGAEYLLSRRWTLAALANFDYFVLRLRGPGGAHPWLACAALRIGRVF
jgi:hypothetical protein